MAEPWIVARTVSAELSSPLVRYANPRNPLTWLRGGEGIVGIGELCRLKSHGANRIRLLADRWRALAAAAMVDDRVGLPGTGLVAFSTFAFAAESAAQSVLIVPEIVVGRHGSRSWVTRLSVKHDSRSGSVYRGQVKSGERVESGKRVESGERVELELPLPQPMPRRAAPRVVLSSSALPPDEYRAAVAAAVHRIDEGELSKVVLARQMVGHLDSNAGLRATILRLITDYPDTWVFSVDGFFGASPETLIRVDHGAISARVLAGTCARGTDAGSDRLAAIALVASTKNQGEHAFAVQSLATRLRAYVSRLDFSPEPFTLQLRNLWHLATDVKGTLDNGAGVLDIVAAVHPTAAVAGTPRRAALAVIAELEGFDRGRYAGPVGWVNDQGDGEFAIALRCAQLTDDGSVIAYAGCGIVQDSQPDQELAETVMKFQPIIEALNPLGW